MIIFGTLPVYGFMMEQSTPKLLSKFLPNFEGMILI